jgi:hypothetical protein
MPAAMPETIEIDVPRSEVGDELTAALAARGLRAERIDDGERCALRVWYADDERARLIGDVTHAVELWLAEQGLPLIVQRAGGGAVVRPPGD